MRGKGNYTICKLILTGIVIYWYSYYAIKVSFENEIFKYSHEGFKQNAPLQPFPISPIIS